jgi:periplasmic mercuric ion binding protein
MTSLRRILMHLSFVALMATSTAQAGDLETVTLMVDEMTCATCPLTVRISLERVNGVESADVDFETKLAIVTFDPDLTDVEALVQATTDVGYPSRPAETEDSV